MTILDGAMGTQLQLRGLQPGEIPELWNLTRPDDIRAVHEAYLAAGANMIYANTFGANAAKYHGTAPLADVVCAGVALAKEAAAKYGAHVALDVGPTGRLLKPAGDFAFDAAYAAFAEQIRLGADAGADVIVLETFADTYELKAAILAAKENANLPVYVTVALSADGKLLTGADVKTIAALFNALKPDAVGFNCGLGPDKLVPFVRELATLTTLPIIVKANAGLPKIVNGETVFTVSPEDFARDLASCAEAGATILGGCCGTTPAHIAAATDALENVTPPCAFCESRAVVSSYSKCVALPFDDSVIIGERINPTGKKRLKEAYLTGDTGYILREAIAQIEAGATILDVNAGVPGIDEPKVLTETMEAIQSVTDAPLQIDTSDPVALERALRHYNGVALVNSVNGKKESMDAVFPLVKKYGGVVVALTLDEKGIPATAEGRVAIAKRILDYGATFGLTKDDFVVDVLCLAVSADPMSARVILESLTRVRAELGVRTILGVSNVSFGLPARPLLNATFYSLALEAGLSSAIVNPLSTEMMTAYRSWRALTGRDVNCAEWIDTAARQMDCFANDVARNDARNQTRTLSYAIIKGLKSDAATFADGLLKSGVTPLDVINGEIVPALEVVGQGFEKGAVFLPQLLMSAEAAAAAFESVKRGMKDNDSELRKIEKSKNRKIILATVKGDIHDIGKNIVRALLENYGFDVIDLGCDVAPEAIVEAALKNDCKLVGLSALMTTTVPFMAETIRQLAVADPSIETFVGGAVLTSDYAAEINATHYAKDAMASVRIAEHFFCRVI